MAAFIRDFNVLQQELEKTKESLKDVDDNIKKLTGRDPTEPGRAGQQRRILLGFNERGATDPAPTNRGGGNSGSSRKRVIPAGKWAVAEADVGPRKKRGNIASRLGPRPSRSSQDSGDADEMVRKPSIASSVVATSRDSLTRKDMLDAQGKDERGMARNKRMFGLLLGTLQKFKDEAKDKKDKHDQRKRVELKLEEKAQQEKDEIRKERELLFQVRREKQTRIRLLEQKMELVSTHEKCEAEIRKLANFICTKTKPCIFYLPKIHTPATESRLSDSTKVVNEMVAERRRRLTAEINELMGTSSFAHLAGDDEDHEQQHPHHHHHHAGLDMEGEEEEDDSENIPAGGVRSRRRHRSSSSRGGGGAGLDSGSLDGGGDKRYPVHYRGGPAANKDWARNKDRKTSSSLSMSSSSSKRISSSGGGGGGSEHHHHQQPQQHHQQHHHHADSKSSGAGGSKHSWGDGYRVSKSSSRESEAAHGATHSNTSHTTTSTAVPAKSASNKWQLLMEMDSGLEEEEEEGAVMDDGGGGGVGSGDDNDGSGEGRVVVPRTVDVGGIPHPPPRRRRTSSGSPPPDDAPVHPPPSSSTRVTRRSEQHHEHDDNNNDDDDKEHRNEEDVDDDGGGGDGGDGGGDKREVCIEDKNVNGTEDRRLVEASGGGSGGGGDVSGSRRRVVLATDVDEDDVVEDGRGGSGGDDGNDDNDDEEDGDGGSGGGAGVDRCRDDDDDDDDDDGTDDVHKS